MTAFAFQILFLRQPLKNARKKRLAFRPEEHPKRKLKLVSFISILESPQTILPQFSGGVGGGGQRGLETPSHRPRQRPRAG